MKYFSTSTIITLLALTLILPASVSVRAQTQLQACKTENEFAQDLISMGTQAIGMKVPVIDEANLEQNKIAAVYLKALYEKECILDVKARARGQELQDEAANALAKYLGPQGGYTYYKPQAEGAPQEIKGPFLVPNVKNYIDEVYDDTITVFLRDARENVPSNHPFRESVLDSLEKDARPDNPEEAYDLGDYVEDPEAFLNEGKIGDNDNIFDALTALRKAANNPIGSFLQERTKLQEQQEKAKEAEIIDLTGHGFRSLKDKDGNIIQPGSVIKDQYTLLVQREFNELSAIDEVGEIGVDQGLQTEVAGPDGGFVAGKPVETFTSNTDAGKLYIPEDFNLGILGDLFGAGGLLEFMREFGLENFAGVFKQIQSLVGGSPLEIFEAVVEELGIDNVLGFGLDEIMGVIKDPQILFTTIPMDRVFETFGVDEVFGTLGLDNILNSTGGLDDLLNSVGVEDVFEIVENQLGVDISDFESVGGILEQLNNLNLPGGDVSESQLDPDVIRELERLMDNVSTSTDSPHFASGCAVKSADGTCDIPQTNTCEIPIGGGLSNSLFLNSQPTNITEDSFRGWASSDPLDISGDIEDLTLVFEGIQLCSTYQHSSSTFLNQGKEAFFQDSFNQQNNLPVTLVGNYYELKEDTNRIELTGGHAVVLLENRMTGVNADGKNEYRIKILDPNGPTVRSASCLPADSIDFWWEYEKSDGTTEWLKTAYDYYCPNLYGAGRHGVLYTGSAQKQRMSLIQANSYGFCQSPQNIQDPRCTRNRSQWVENNYPAIPNTYGQVATDGFCSGWSESVLAVTYLGNFIGECNPNN